MPLDFKQLISLLSDFCCFMEVYRCLLGRLNSGVVSCWSVMINSMYLLLFLNRFLHSSFSIIFILLAFCHIIKVFENNYAINTLQETV